MGVQWQLTGRQKALTTPYLELIKGCCHGYISVYSFCWGCHWREGNL